MRSVNFFAIVHLLSGCPNLRIVNPSLLSFLPRKGGGPPDGGRPPPRRWERQTNGLALPSLFAGSGVGKYHLAGSWFHKAAGETTGQSGFGGFSSWEGFPRGESPWAAFFPPFLGRARNGAGCRAGTRQGMGKHFLTAQETRPAAGPGPGKGWGKNFLTAQETGLACLTAGSPGVPRPTGCVW